MAIKFEKAQEGTYKLDCCGYVCPHPQIYTKKMLDRIEEGNVLEVVFDNPSSSESITAMCEAAGHDVLEKTMDSGKYVYKIKKRA